VTARCHVPKGTVPARRWGRLQFCELRMARGCCNYPPSNRVVSREQGNLPIAEHVLSVLTNRERQIMRLVSEGLSNKEIGRRLSITDGTMKVHLHHIFQKLDVSNRSARGARHLDRAEL
jgi:DNA-binding NarL/FixJ family response regulator